MGLNFRLKFKILQIFFSIANILSNVEIKILSWSVCSLNICWLWLDMVRFKLAFSILLYSQSAKKTEWNRRQSFGWHFPHHPIHSNHWLLCFLAVCKKGQLILVGELARVSLLGALPRPRLWPFLRSLCDIHYFNTVFANLFIKTTWCVKLSLTMLKCTKYVWAYA